MGNNAFDDLKKRAREDAYADIRQWMFWLPLTPNELTILGAIYAVQIENEDWGDEFALMEERWCSGFPYFRECLAKLLKLGYVRESVNRSGYPSSYLISAKACLEDGESNGYDKENPKIPDWYWNVWDDYDCWSNSLNGNEITYRFLRKRGCPAYLAKTIASKLRLSQAGSSMELILSSQLMGTRGGDTSGSWFPGEPETPQKRHGKGCGGTPFSMPFLLSH